jgi:hypothetical protein
MSPRAAWRLEQLGFGEVYDYVASKMDWLGAGLPVGGELAGRSRLGTLAEPAVPTCGIDDRVAEVRDRVGSWELCVVVNDERVVLGLVRTEALGLPDDTAVVDVMQEAPKTFRPHLTPDEVTPQLDASPRPWLLVTNLDGTLVGVARPEHVRSADRADG